MQFKGKSGHTADKIKSCTNEEKSKKIRRENLYTYMCKGLLKI